MRFSNFILYSITIQLDCYTPLDSFPLFLNNLLVVEFIVDTGLLAHVLEQFVQQLAHSAPQHKFSQLLAKHL